MGGRALQSRSVSDSPSALGIRVRESRAVFAPTGSGGHALAPDRGISSPCFQVSPVRLQLEAQLCMAIRHRHPAIHPHSGGAHARTHAPARAHARRQRAALPERWAPSPSMPVRQSRLAPRHACTPPDRAQDICCEGTVSLIWPVPLVAAVSTGFKAVGYALCCGSGPSGWAGL